MRKRLIVALALGLVVAVFVSACGVALGPVQFTAGGTAVLGPTIGGLHLPSLRPAASLSSMHEMQRWQSIQEQALAGFGYVSCHGAHGGE